MRAAARVAFPAFTERFEGALPWMYLDKLGYVTTGYGNKLGAPSEATALRWRRADGSLATLGEIVAAWAKVNAHQEMRPLGGGHLQFQELTSLRLDQNSVMALFWSGVRVNDALLNRRYGDFESFPADAHVALHSLAWAVGGNYTFPRMDTALAMWDFETAATEINMPPEHNPGNDLRARNAANQILMRNAASVVRRGLDPDVLHYPTSLAALEQDEIETAPELPNAASEPTIYPAPPAAEPEECPPDSETAGPV